MFGIVTLLTPTLTIVACNNDTPIEITNDDIYDEPGKTGKIDKITFTFLYALTDDKKPNHKLEHFYNWDWNLNNRFKIIWNNHVGSSNPEYWQITLQKTKQKSVFVSEYQKSDKPIKNALKFEHFLFLYHSY